MNSVSESSSPGILRLLIASIYLPARRLSSILSFGDEMRSCFNLTNCSSKISQARFLRTFRDSLGFCLIEKAELAVVVLLKTVLGLRILLFFC